MLVDDVEPEIVEILEVLDELDDDVDVLGLKVELDVVLVDDVELLEVEVEEVLVDDVELKLLSDWSWRLSLRCCLMMKRNLLKKMQRG